MSFPSLRNQEYSPRVPGGLTVALIVQNEAANLEQLLPLLAWADEVVVVDGGSTDATPEVVRRHGARLLSHPFDHFAAQRERARQAARCAWVLSIDADERPEPGLAASIARAAGSGRAAGLRLPIRSTILGRPFRYSGTQDDWPIRLFRRDAARWQGRVHETLLVDGPVQRLSQGLTHTTLGDAWAFAAKMNRYTALAATARVLRGRPPRRGERWWAPALEVGRRLLWKRGLLDGPAGWAFCLLSGVSAWVLAERHARYWRQAQAGLVPAPPRAVRGADTSGGASASDESQPAIQLPAWPALAQDDGDV